MYFILINKTTDSLHFLSSPVYRVRDIFYTKFVRASATDIHSTLTLWGSRRGSSQFSTAMDIYAFYRDRRYTGPSLFSSDPCQERTISEYFHVKFKKFLNIQFLINLGAECRFFCLISIDMIYNIFHGK